VRALIQKKVDDGSEITESATATKPQAQVIDLMEALKASLAGSRPRSTTSKPAATSAKTTTKTEAKPEAKRKPAQAAPRGVASKVVKAAKR
jgi:non-homologous end joining protein Ku